VLPVYALLHDIISPVALLVVGLPIFWVIGLFFAFVGVFISRKYGPASLALSTGAFCFAVLVLFTGSGNREEGGLIVVPIAGGIAQGIVIAARTRNGRGRSSRAEAMIGSGVFVAATIVAALVAVAIFS
jgi:hypothetical protein